MPINSEGLYRIVNQSFPKVDTTANKQNKSIEFPKSDNNTDEHVEFHRKLAGLHMDIPAFSGMLVNDEIGTAILNYKYNNNLLTDTNTVYILTNDNAVIPTGDPGLKPVELLSWAKDFKSSSVPYRIPGFSSPDSKQDYPSLRFNAKNPINCSNANFGEIKKAIQDRMGNLNSKLYEYAKRFYDKHYFIQQKYGSLDAFVDNMYAIIYRESKGNPNAENRKNSNGTWDCGLMQINTRYANYDFTVLLKNYDRDLYNYFMNNDVYREHVNAILKNNDKEQICKALKNPEINLAIAFALLTANVKNRNSIVNGNLAYGGDPLVQRGVFMSPDANCIFIKYLQKYPNLDDKKFLDRFKLS